MSTTLIMIIATWTTLYCQNTVRYMAGMNATALAGGEVSLMIERGISCHWSIGGLASYGFGNNMKRPGKLESSHLAEFGETVFRPMPSDRHHESIYLKYWPMKVMTGPYLLTSISNGNTSGTGLDIGAGYLMPIWKVFNIYIEYNYTISDADTPSKGVSLGTCLVFGK